MSSTKKKLAKCDECGKALPTHLLGLSSDFQHICSCTAAYVDQKGQFVRAGNQRNPVAEYDREQAAKKKAAKKAKKSEKEELHPIVLNLTYRGKTTEYTFSIRTAEDMVDGLKKQIAAAKRIMGGRDRRRPTLKRLLVPKKIGTSA